MYTTLVGFSLMACDLLPCQSKGGEALQQKEAIRGALSASNKEMK